MLPRDPSRGDATKRRATIKDVAKRAGVSIATVSFVLNDRPGQSISERVRQKVSRAAAELSYHPSAMAAGLARKRTHNVAIVFFGSESLVSNHFYSFVVEGAIKEAIRRDYNLLFSFMSGEYSTTADLPKIIRENNAEGALFIRELHPALVQEIQSRGIPVIAIDNFPHLSTIHSFAMDCVAGGRLATRHLLELGHRQIVFLHAALERPSIAERGEGFRLELESHGVPFFERRHFFACKSYTFEAGLQATTRLLSRKHPPTALFCANDEIAAGALRAAHLLGLSVPADLSIVGFDDITLSNYTDPPLTTVGGDKDVLGSRAMARLIDIVDGTAPKPWTTQPARDLVDVRLVVRESTARVPRRPID